MSMKKAKVLIAAAALALLLGGCGKGSTENTVSSTETAKAEPTEALLILYGDESQRMREFSENEFHDRVLDEINVDVTIQYLPWSEYAGGKSELMLSSEKNLQPIQILPICPNVFQKDIMPI